MVAKRSLTSSAILRPGTSSSVLGFNVDRLNLLPAVTLLIGGNSGVYASDVSEYGLLSVCLSNTSVGDRSPNDAGLLPVLYAVSKNHCCRFALLNSTSTAYSISFLTFIATGAMKSRLSDLASVTFVTCFPEVVAFSIFLN